MSARPQPGAARGGASSGASPRPASGAAGTPSPEAAPPEASAPSPSPADAPAVSTPAAGEGEAAVDPLAHAAELAAAQGDVPKVTKATITGATPAELAEMGKVEIPVGLELACDAFEDGELRSARVLSVHPEGALLHIEGLDWRWPVLLERINPAKGEWVHVDADYPRPGENAVFDTKHRMSAEERQRREEERRRAETPAPARAAALSDAMAARNVELPSGGEDPGPPSSRPPPAHPEIRSGQANVRTILATWLGPGNLAGGFVDISGKPRDMAKPNTRGYFAARTVEHANFKGKFRLG